MRGLAIIALLTLTACGADGEPERPTMKAGGNLASNVAFGTSGDN